MIELQSKLKLEWQNGRLRFELEATRFSSRDHYFAVHAYPICNFELVMNKFQLAVTSVKSKLRLSSPEVMFFFSD